MMNGGKRKIELIEYVGLFLVAFSFLMLVVNPGGIGNLFNNMFNHAAPIIIKVYITGSIGIAIIISVTMGRLLERLGFTDALMRIFVPLMKVIGVNAAVAVPSVYNILGDINAAGRIGGPILKKIQSHQRRAENRYRYHDAVAVLLCDLRFRLDCFERRQGFRLGRRFSGGVPAGAFDAAASASHYLARHQSCLA